MSASEVSATYQQLLSGPNGSAFAASLGRRGLSSADELMVLRLGALAQRLRSKIIGAPGSVLPAQARKLVGAFLIAYQQRWKKRTSCQPGYVIAECANGPPPPASRGGA